MPCQCIKTITVIFDTIRVGKVYMSCFNVIGSFYFSIPATDQENNFEQHLLIASYELCGGVVSKRQLLNFFWPKTKPLDAFQGLM